MSAMDTGTGGVRPTVTSVFDVWATYDMNWRRPHYPAYPVTTRKIGSALTLADAERIVRDAVRMVKEERWSNPLHSLRVREVPAGQYTLQWESLSEHVYDRNGALVDRRTFPNAGGVFPGRSPDRIRFGAGDLCEVLRWDDTVSLGIVLDPPPGTDYAERLNRGQLKLDAEDDSYVVLSAAGVPHGNPFHADSLDVFRPAHKVSARTEGRLRRAYNDYLTAERRRVIADTAAAAVLREAVGEAGWDGTVEAPRWDGDSFKLRLEGVPGFPRGLDLQVPQKKARDHMDRVLVSLRRLAGKSAGGRGYRLKRIPPPPPLRKGLPAPEPDPEGMYCL